MLQRGHSADGCVLTSTLCRYDLRKGDLFVLSWARVRRVRWGSIFSELLMCGGGVRSILLLPLLPISDVDCSYMLITLNWVIPEHIVRWAINHHDVTISLLYT